MRKKMLGDDMDRAQKHQDFAKLILTKMVEEDYNEADALTLLVGLMGKVLSMSHGEQLEEKVHATCNAIRVCTNLYKDIYKTLKDLTDGDV